MARGEVTAGDEVRLEAMLRCAKMYHASKDRVKALQAYRECAEVSDRTAFDPNIHLELAGLYMELARSGCGSLDDCIHECNRILSADNATSETSATAMVMKGEALYLQYKYDESYAVMSELLQHYSGIRRPAMMAQLYLGAIHFVKKEYQQARQEFQKVLDNYTDADNWPGKNLRGQALLFLARTDLEEKNFARAGAIFEEVYKTYRNTKEGKKAKTYLIRHFPFLWQKINKTEGLK